MLTIVMLVGILPLAQIAEWDLSGLFLKAEASAVGYQTVIGTMNDYETTVFVVINGDYSEEYVSKIIIDGVSYSVGRGDISIESAESLKQQIVVLVLQNNSFYSLRALSEVSPWIQSNIEGISLNYTKNGKIKEKSVNLTGYFSFLLDSIYDTNAFNQKNLDISEATVVFETDPNGLCTYSSSDSFDVDLGESFTFGTGWIENKIKLQLNQNAVTMSENEPSRSFTINYSIRGKFNGRTIISQLQTIDVTIKNEGYKAPEPRQVTILQFLYEIKDGINQYIESNEYKKKHKNDYAVFYDLKTYYEIAWAGANLSNAAKHAVADANTIYSLASYLEDVPFFADKIADFVLDKIKEDTDGAAEELVTLFFENLKSHEDFNDFLNWYKNRQRNHVFIGCPIDIDVFSSSGDLLVSIISDQIVCIQDGCDAFVDNDCKYICFDYIDDYRICITATDDGEMFYEANIVFAEGRSRTVRHDSVKITKDVCYETCFPANLAADQEYFNLYTSTGEIIEVTYDSLPSVETNVVDVVVAEELFEGFSTELIDIVADAMFNMHPSVDISSYLITVDDIMGLFSAVQKYYPSEYSIMSKTDFSYKAIVSPSKRIVTGFRFYYDSDVSLSVYQKRVRDLQIEIDKIVAMTEGMTDFEKILFVHDYIVLNCEYDYDLLEMLNNQNGRLDGEIRSERYTEYSVLVNGTGICGSYALAYRAVLNAAGVECLYLSSEEMNHAWNLVKIDGNWYHCDLTWDDTGYGNDYHYGIAERTYFLRTDAEIMRLNHRTWTPGQYKATSEAFSEMPRYEDYKQKYDGGNWYYLSGGKIYSSDIYGDNEREVAEVTASAMEVANGEIYYSVGRNILHYYPDSDVSKYAYVLPNNKAGEETTKASIRNFYVDGNNTTIYVRGVFDGKTTTTKCFDSLNEAIYEEITGISLSTNNLSVDVFDTTFLNVQIESTNTFPNGEMIWSSSDEMIAKVSDTGVVTGRNVGSAIITVEYCGYTAECEVTVTGDGLTGTCGESVYWSFDAGQLTISGTGNMPDYTYNNYTSAPWYSKLRNQITSLAVNGLSNIGDFAFYGYRNIKTITIASNVTNIGVSAFQYCSELEDVFLPDSLDTINKSAFYGCEKLGDITVPDGVISIGESAFNQCHSFTHIVIPESVVSIGKSAFYECFNVVQYVVDNNNTAYYSDSYGVLFEKTTNKLIAFPSGSNIEEYTIPENVQTIGRFSFYQSYNLRRITIPSSVSFIEAGAFGSCNKLTQISIPEGVTDIEAMAFSDCSSLADVILPNTITKIGMAAFENCVSLSDVVIPDSIISVANAVFSGCTNLVSISLPDSILELGGYAFANCTSLRSIDIPEHITNIQGCAFQNCESLTSIDIPSSVLYIGGEVFEGCINLRSVSIPDGVTNIGFSAFENCTSLQSIEIPNSVRIIGEYTFAGCYSLKEIRIPGSVSFIRERTFLECKNLKQITIEEGVTTIGTCAFASCEQLKSVIIPNSVTAISYGAFAGSNLEHFLIKNAGTTIGNKCVECGIVFGHGNSSAQNFAEENSLAFINIDAEPHEHDYFLMDYVEKTDDTDGYELWECYCGESSYVVIDHHYVDSESSATCIQPGLQSKVCCVCGDVDSEETPALGHDWQEVSRIVGNCQKPTEITYQCTRCPETRIEIVNADLEHSYVETVIKPNCLSYGYNQYVCSICGEEIVSDFKAPLGHKLSITGSTENCSAHGSLIYSCSRCDYREEIAVEKVDLETTTVTTPATCTTAGSEKQVCVLCGATVSTTILPATGHSFDADSTTDVPATCTAEGVKSRHCAKCGLQILTEPIEAKGHSFGEWTLKTSPTCTDAGVEQRVCANDPDHVETRPVDPTGHSFGAWTFIDAPTCTETGLEQRVCANDPEHIETRPVAATGHTDPDGDGICNECGVAVNNGGSSHSSNCVCGQYHTGPFAWLIKFFHTIIYFFRNLFGKK